jgi:hypothetical protein
VANVDPLNLPEKEFEAVMADIDSELRKENDKIVGREIRGWMKFCQRFHISAALGDPVANRLFEWFKTIYGDRLNVDIDFSKSFVSIRGDAYGIRCFRFFGVICAICSVEMLGREIRQRTEHRQERTVINLLDESIEGLTLALAERMSPAERGGILMRYAQMFKAFSAIEGALGARQGGDDAPYMKEAFDDLRKQPNACFCGHRITGSPTGLPCRPRRRFSRATSSRRVVATGKSIALMNFARAHVRSDYRRSTPR